MSGHEVVFPIALKAMELGYLKLIRYSSDDGAEIERWNAFNAKQISDFINALTDGIYPVEPL